MSCVVLVKAYEASSMFSRAGCQECFAICCILYGLALNRPSVLCHVEVISEPLHAKDAAMLRQGASSGLLGRQHAVVGGVGLAALAADMHKNPCCAAMCCWLDVTVQTCQICMSCLAVASSTVLCRDNTAGWACFVVVVLLGSRAGPPTGAVACAILFTSWWCGSLVSVLLLLQLVISDPAVHTAVQHIQLLL